MWTRAGGLFERLIREPGRFTISVCAGMLGAAILYLAMPQMIAAFILLPGNGILGRIQKGEDVSRAELLILAESRRSAANWVDSGRILTDLALAQIELAKIADFSSAAGRRSLDEAIVSVKHGLSLGPANAYAWARLAYLLIVQSNDAVGAADALRMSILVGPHERSLTLWRIQLCLTIWPYIDEDTRSLVAQQIRAHWNIIGWEKRKEFARIIRSHEAQGTVRRALKTLPIELADFERALRSI